MGDDISIRQQAAEVRNIALGAKAQSETAAWQKRHGTDEGLARKDQQLRALFAAADALDRLVEAGQESAVTS